MPASSTPRRAIDHAALKAAGLARGGKDGVRLLGKGEFTAKLSFKVAGVSKGAREAVEKAGGSVEVPERKTQPSSREEGRTAAKPTRPPSAAKCEPAIAGDPPPGRVDFAARGFDIALHRTIWRRRARSSRAARSRHSEITMASRADNIASNLSLANFAKATELKKRIWFTIGALIVFRFLSFVPLPGVDPLIARDALRRRRAAASSTSSTPSRAAASSA